MISRRAHHHSFQAVATFGLTQLPAQKVGHTTVTVTRGFGLTPSARVLERTLHVITLMLQGT